MNEKILLVDDDEVLSQVLQRVLSQEGYTVLRAASVAQALELDAQQRPQLGLLDLCLPDGDGVQLADALRAQHPGIPLLLMTAYSGRLRQHRTGERFLQVLTKPLNVTELRQALKAALAAPVAPVLSSVPASQVSALPCEVP